MAAVIFFNSYKLKKGASVQDFLIAVEKLHNEYIAEQHGYISFKLLAEGDTWADFTTFETLDDAKRFAESDTPNELAQRFYSFINMNSCKTHYFSVEKSFQIK